MLLVLTLHYRQPTHPILNSLSPPTQELFLTILCTKESANTASRRTKIKNSELSFHILMIMHVVIEFE